MDADKVVARLYESLKAYRQVSRLQPETVKAILREELERRAARYEKDQKGVMAATMAAALRRTAEKAR